MKCDKCGTPIIPGENTCRFCGNATNFSKREKKIEVIDFPEEFETTKESIDLPNVQAYEPKTEEKSKLSDLDINEKKVEEDNIELPDLEEIIGSTNINLNLIDDNKEEVNPIVESDISKQEKPKKKIIEEVEKAKQPKKSALDKVAKNESNKTELEKSDGKIPSAVGIVLLTFILLCSVGLNIYLFVMDGNKEAKNSNKPVNNEPIYSNVSYEDYKLTIPATWTTEGQEKSLLIYDDNETWAANMQIVDKASYDAFLTNKDTLVQSLAGLKYQFTSNYSKKVEDKEYYLFKGKYYNYSVFVIVNALSDSKLLVTDLKFKGEVDDILLNNILTVCGTIKDNDTEDLFKENFEFNNLSEKVLAVSQNKE